MTVKPTVPQSEDVSVRASAALAAVTALRAAVHADGASLLASYAGGRPVPDDLGNLACYIALRRHDIRPLQRQLMALGLSSLGRLESRVLPTLDAVTVALAALVGRPAPLAPPTEAEFFAGERLLAAETDRLFGSPPRHRRGRIMVTLSSEVITNPSAAEDLVAHGMDVARINCAHDDAAAWGDMARIVRAAASRRNRQVRILMDIAGPKIRTEAVATLQAKAKLAAGDRLRLTLDPAPVATPEAPFCAAVSLPEMITRLAVGQRLRYDDGKLEGMVEAVTADTADVRVRRVKAGGVKLKPGKGLNLPDTALGLSPLTDKDAADLDAVVAHADMVGYSFVSDPTDIDLLERLLTEKGVGDRPLGLVAKIELPAAVRNLPALIARARGRRPFGVMIARGDLAAEIGFTRLAEMQEEILWIAEAAHVPVVWATQVLEDLVKDGVPSRGEMTDAAMAARAECVMLNKGPEIATAVDLLDGLLARMDDHVFKKTPTLRALATW